MHPSPPPPPPPPPPQTASNGTKTQVYYPSRPRSHSDGSSICSSRRNGSKLLASFNNGKVLSGRSGKPAEEDKRRPGSGGCGTRYKTELCRPFQEYGFCKYGDKCQFAHGEHEIRALPRHPKYKTELCRTYHAKGFCPYGPRCHFIHNLEEARLAEAAGQKSPSKTGPLLFSLPISPSFDSGISSPDDNLGFLTGGSRVFEFPGSEGGGSDEGEDSVAYLSNSFGDSTYSPIGEDPFAAEDQFGSPDAAYFEYDGLSSSSGNGSPLKNPSTDGLASMPLDPTSHLQQLLSGIRLDNTSRTPSEQVTTTSYPPPQVRVRPCSASSTRRLRVFNDILNSKSETLLVQDERPGRVSPPFNLLPLKA